MKKGKIHINLKQIELEEVEKKVGVRVGIQQNIK